MTLFAFSTDGAIYRSPSLDVFNCLEIAFLCFCIQITVCIQFFYDRTWALEEEESPHAEKPREISLQVD